MLSTEDLLEAAAFCGSGSSVEASVHLAALALPGLSFDEAAQLPIGTRDAALVRLYTAMFGHRLEIATTCPHCGTRLDIELNTDALLADTFDADAWDGEASIEIGDQLFAVRPPNSFDLAAVAELADIETGRLQLALGCLVPHAGATAPETLSVDQIDQVSDVLATLDPGSDFYVPLTCFACRAAWDAPVDAPRILATEIEAAADILLDDVHELALAYHWSESAILALPASRRRAYLARLGR